jgi:hypothetical protein
MYWVKIKVGIALMIPNRSREVLFPLITQFVRRGTKIYTDSATVYIGLENLRYEHFTVNHSNGEFVNYETGCTTMLKHTGKELSMLIK